MRTVASRVLPPGVKRGLKRLMRAYHQRFFAFTPADLQRALLQLGVLPGDVLMVHSAFDRFLGFHGGPVDVIRALQQVVGPDGTLMMPTIPFQGSAIEYALGEPVFDARQTVSRMGLITEVFRRAPGVVRSVHPTHSVAVWGS
ncbi:MAG TPA: AAC(3) family N-acetyltransferase, partial [Gemmatimonadales bacterium]|nr:AAC(3) family N-acetyltransferase [Gemmatimonadales bacterium]